MEGIDATTETILTIFDAIGNAVYHRNALAYDQERHFLIELPDHLQKGIYHIVVTNSEKGFQQKILVQ
jgi:hypothetical protein